MNHDMSNIDILKPHFPNVTSKLKYINKNKPFSLSFEVIQKSLFDFLH